MRFLTYFLILLLLLTLSCNNVRHQPRDGPVSDVLRKAGRIIYVSKTGSDKGNGSRYYPLASIQKAIDIAAPGDVVRVGPGIYTENIVLRSRVSLVGSGADVTILTSESGSILTANNVFGVTIEGFTLDGKDSAQYGLWAQCQHIQSRSKSHSPTMIIFRNNVVKNFLIDGIHGEYVNITIEGSTITSIVGSGIRLFRSFSSIRSNKISFAGSGISLQDGRSSIHNNTIEDIHANGILCHFLTSAVIRFNRLTRIGVDGIRCEHTSPVIRDNYITGAVNGIGCYAEETRPSCPKIRGNIITGNKRGIYIDKNSRPDLGREDDPGNNSIFNNEEFAVYSESKKNIPAIGNWWGTPTPDQSRFHGRINYEGNLPSMPWHRVKEDK